jgi:hypothetical protein
MQRRLLMLTLALSFVAAAQTMTGLPGVQLVGTVQAAQIINTTSKAIVCVVVRSEGTGPGKPITLAAWPPPIQADGAPHDIQQVVPNPRAPSPEKTYIDGVVFEDGTFIGPDNGKSFPTLTGQVAAYVANGTLLATATDTTAAWSQLQSLSTGPGNAQGVSREADGAAFALKNSAMMLVQTRARYGDAAAAAMAAKYVALGKLHKSN